jgi:1,4-dihydroxy-6-naphthoate synthase
MPATPASTQTPRLGHSPDPDDAFMWYPLANFTAPDGVTHTPRIDTGRFAFEHVLEDIQALNERSFRGELEITAISIHTYPYVADRYALTSCGASLGDGYGPMIVTADPDFDPAALTQPGGPTLAIPGKQTSAWLATQLWLREAHRLQSMGFRDNPASSQTPASSQNTGSSAGRPSSQNDGPGAAVNHEVVPFDQIIDKVVAGEYAAGLIIHEGQITYRDHDLHLIVDLGRWWRDTRQLPLPLGGNCVRRDLGQPAMSEVCRILKNSIQYALDHREEAVDFALH